MFSKTLHDHQRELDKSLLVKIAQMYYQENLTQGQISKSLGIHRSTISRLLKQSRDEGIVEITIDYPSFETDELAQALAARYGLRKAVIIPASPDLSNDLVLQLLGKACGRFLRSILEDDMTIGFSWGQAVSECALHLEAPHKEGLLCVPLIGGPAGRLASQFHVNTITYEAAQRLEAQGLLIDAPALPDTLPIRASLMRDPFNLQLVDLWDRLAVAVFGIGSLASKEGRSWGDFYGTKTFHQLEQQGAVGDITSRFFDENGRAISSELDQLLIGIDLQTLKKVPYRIGIAASQEKVAAIKGALLGGHCNCLITTEATAEALLA